MRKLHKLEGEDLPPRQRVRAIGAWSIKASTSSKPLQPAPQSPWAIRGPRPGIRAPLWVMNLTEIAKGPNARRCLKSLIQKLS